MATDLRQRIEEDVKAAMRAKDKARLGALRMLLAAIKQQEIDKQVTLDEAGLIAVLEKMIKQRRDALTQYQNAGRQELADKEGFEINIIEEYLPPALSEEEIATLVNDAIAEAGATSTKDMGKVMGAIKPKLQGRADMTLVSKLVQSKLSTLSQD